MSASAPTLARRLPPDSRLRPSDPPQLRLFELSVGLPAVVLVGLLAVLERESIEAHVIPLLAWLAVVVLVDLFPVRYTNHQFTMSVAVLLAAGMVFSVGEVGVLALLGSADPREFRREITVARAIFNRGQIALSAMAASTLFHFVGGDIRHWPGAVGAAALAAGADTAVNLLIVSMAPVVVEGRGLSKAFRFLFGELIFEAPWEATIGYLSLASLALLFAAAYAYQGLWGLLAALIPVLVVRQAFSNRRSLSTAVAEVADKTHLLEQVTRTREEDALEARRQLAADLHDEVLPALFKVHLMGQVIRMDLESGRLLDMDADLLQLLDATDRAADEMRSVITSLRATSMGRAGVTPTLGLLVKDLSRDASAKLELDAAEVGCSPLIQLLIYQVAREAIRNAVSHAHAHRIEICLRKEGRLARLSVIDDGDGFDVAAATKTGHFGLQMMHERVQMAGGQLSISSQKGSGTKVIACFPQDAR